MQIALAVLVLFSPQEFEVADATTTEGEIKDWQPDRGLNASHTAQNKHISPVTTCYYQ